MTRDQAKLYRAIIERAASSLDDQTASIAPELCPRLKQDGSLIPVGTRINWNGTLKQSAVDLWDLPSNTPDAAPTLWTDIQYRKGYRIIPDVITVTTAFSDGECGWWGDTLYRSKVNANVYTPEQYAANWEAIAT